MHPTTAYCTRWGAKFGARRVFGLSVDEKKAIRAGQMVTIDAPTYRGVNVRRVALVSGRFYARMPQTGCFLFDEKHWQETGEFKAISPICSDLLEFYKWDNTNGNNRGSRYLERTTC